MHYYETKLAYRLQACIQIASYARLHTFRCPHFPRNAVFYPRITCYVGFPGGSVGKESAHKVGALGPIPGLGSSLGEGNGYLLQYSGLENAMDCIVHRVTKSWT